MSLIPKINFGSKLADSTTLFASKGYSARSLVSGSPLSTTS
jgi:hypothetical protein